VAMPVLALTTRRGRSVADLIAPPAIVVSAAAAPPRQRRPVDLPH
jgi:hypothetical protein